MMNYAYAQTEHGGSDSMSQLQLAFAALQKNPPQDAAAMRTWLEASRAFWSELTTYYTWDRKTYTRQVLFSSDKTEIVLVCWHHSQISPVHDHKGSLCGYLVIEGELEERVPNAQQGACLRAGEVQVFTDGWRRHAVTCTTEKAVSLHCYSPPIS